jgi:hypothetical protein
MSETNPKVIKEEKYKFFKDDEGAKIPEKTVIDPLVEENMQDNNEGGRFAKESLRAPSVLKVEDLRSSDRRDSRLGSEGTLTEPPGGAKRRFSIDSPNGLSTENAVKPRSSVDVDERSSSKSIDNERLKNVTQKIRKTASSGSKLLKSALSSGSKTLKSAASSGMSTLKRVAEKSSENISNAYSKTFPLTDLKVLTETEKEFKNLKNELERIKNIVNEKDFKGLTIDIKSRVLSNIPDYDKDKMKILLDNEDALYLRQNSDGSSENENEIRKEELYNYFTTKFPFSYLELRKKGGENYKKSDDDVIIALLDQSMYFSPENIKNKTDSLQTEIDKVNSSLYGFEEDKKAKKVKDVKSNKSSIKTPEQKENEKNEENVIKIKIKQPLIEIINSIIVEIDNLISQIDENINPDKESINGPGKAEKMLTTPEFDIVSRVFPAPFVNTKGFRIGDYHIIINSKKLPFNSTDQANHFLYNLFEYVNYEGTPKTSRKMKKAIRDFFKHKEIKLSAFQPIKYPDPSQQEFLKQQQELLREENKKLRENLKKLKYELAGFTGDTENAELHKEVVSEIEERLSKTDPNNRREVLAAYLDVVDDEENLLDDPKKEKQLYKPEKWGGPIPGRNPDFIEDRIKDRRMAAGGRKKKTLRKKMKNSSTKKNKQTKKQR